MAENVAVLMLVLYTRQVHFVEENPAGTHLYDYDSQVFLREMLGLKFIHTWMICFGHFMPKPTRLLGSLVGLASLARKYSTRIWERRRKVLLQKIAKHNLGFRRTTAVKWYQKRSQHKESVKYQKKKNGSGTWTTGGKDLKSSAAYTRRFADCLLSTWEYNRFHLDEPAFRLNELLPLCPFPMDHKRPQCKKSAGPSGRSVETAQPLKDVEVDPTSRPSRCTCWYNNDPPCRACRRLPVLEPVVEPRPDHASSISVPEISGVRGVPEFPMLLSVPNPTSIGHMWANEFEVADFMDTD